MSYNIREKWIDNAKGIAILLVIIGHVSGGLSGILSFNFVYGVHLVVFFILSGYTLKKEKITNKFLNKKFSRLMAPYFYTCVAIMIMDVINSIVINHDGSINTVTDILGKDIIRSFMASGSRMDFSMIDVGTRIGAIWFLPAMFFSVLIMQMLLQYITDDRVLGFVTALISIFGYITARFIWLPFSIQAGMMAVIFIWLGYEIKKLDILNNIKWYHYLYAQIIFLAGIYFGYCNISFVNADINDLFFSTIIGIAGCLLIYYLSVRYPGNILQYIGQRSLIVLCVHLFALETMGTYINIVLDKIGWTGNQRVWFCIIIEVLFAILGVVIIEWIKTWKNLLDRKERVVCSKRNVSIDVTKGFLILFMLIGYFSIDNKLRMIIYSCHMIAFIFLSGYFYNPSRGVKETLQRMSKSQLRPYFIFMIGVFLLNISNWNANYLKQTLKQYLLGMSFAKKIFLDVPSVGPVYFILMLFWVRIIYLLVDRLIKNERKRWCVTFVISVFGLFLGKSGFWLPWSLDIACYAVIFYKIGLYFRTNDLLKKSKDISTLYFILTPIWAYMIYAGSMEIAVRNYGQYGLVIIGAVAGSIIIYMLGSYISDNCLFIRKVLSIIGENSIIIIIVHTLLGKMICQLVSSYFRLDNITYLICSITIQIIISLLIKKLILILGKIEKNIRLHYLNGILN